MGNELGSINYYFASTYKRSGDGCGARSVFSNGVRMYFAAVTRLWYSTASLLLGRTFGSRLVFNVIMWHEVLPIVSSFCAVACYSFAEVLFNNYSSSPNGLRVNSPFGLRPHGLLTQTAIRAILAIVLVKSNYLVKNIETKQV